MNGARSATTEWQERRGLSLVVTTRGGETARGEASPLPGYSTDTLDEARAALESISWERMPEPERGESARAVLARMPEEAALERSPAARFAVETALLDLLGQRSIAPIWALFGDAVRTRGPVPLGALAGSAQDPLAPDAARAAVERGIDTVKLKVSGPVVGEQLAVLARVRDAIGPRRLRLDANGSFDPETAHRELALLADLAPEFLEEPVPAPALDALRTPPLPIALDESLQAEIRWARLAPQLGRLRCVALVLKPMALGGFSRCVALAARAAEHGVHATVSHLFDGPVALAASAHLALAVGSREHASGLDRHGGLAAWPGAVVPVVGTRTAVLDDRPGLGVTFPEDEP